MPTSKHDPRSDNDTLSDLFERLKRLFANPDPIGELGRWQLVRHTSDETRW